jgi:WhiB family redox-sensing transcriptional regulator
MMELTTDIDDGSWKTRAQCRNQDTELFFPTRINEDAPHDDDEAVTSNTLAERVCWGDKTLGIPECPVRLYCLRDALDHGDIDGIWGGTTPRMRRTLRRFYFDYKSKFSI